jgi:hypothetical protein
MSPLPAGPLGSYSKGGSELGMVSGMGAEGGQPAPGAMPDVQERLKQVGGLCAQARLQEWCCDAAS